MLEIKGQAEQLGQILYEISGMPKTFLPLFLLIPHLSLGSPAGRAVQLELWLKDTFSSASCQQLNLKVGASTDFQGLSQCQVLTDLFRCEGLDSEASVQDNGI